MILSQRSDRRSKPHIRQNLKHRDDKVRKYALLAYSRLQPDDLLERCQTVLRFDRSDRVQHQAILLLGQFGGVEVVDSLIRHLDDSESRGVRLALFTALRRLTGLDLGRRQGDWQAWWTNHREEVLADADLL
jgi:HEAT repeat protein